MMLPLKTLSFTLRAWTPNFDWDPHMKVCMGLSTPQGENLMEAQDHLQ